MSNRWQINGSEVYLFLEERRTWQELTLKFRTPKSVLNNTLRPLDDAEGKFDIVENEDGSFEIEDRSDGRASVSVTPPDGRSSLRTVSSYYVEEYDEKLFNAESDVYDAELTLVADGPKAGGSHGTVTQVSDEWLFEFADGEVATNRIRRNVNRGGSSLESTINVEAAFTLQETIVLEDSLNRQAAVTKNTVEDGVDYSVDENANNRNTVSVTQSTDRDPNGDILPTDDYVVLGWETQLINDEFSQVELRLTPV